MLVHFLEMVTSTINVASEHKFAHKLYIIKHKWMTIHSVSAQ